MRIQRRRTRGWKMPEGAVYVGRPTKWGNPWIVDHNYDAASIVAQYRAWMIGYYCDTWCPEKPEPGELRGKDLVCWCPLDQPCHADVLLELANAL
jgi:hypothetical protein